MDKLSQGAEAVLRCEGGAVVKDRIRKGYRINKLDVTLRRQRTAHEATLLNAARRAGVCTPQVLDVSESVLKIELIKGERVKELLDAKNCEKLGELIGEAIGRLHTYDIIHGDLTTSNMIVRDENVCFIDFGLGFQSPKMEDKAVDLYLLHHALESTHWAILKKTWAAVLRGYKQRFVQADKVVKTLASIEKRGRYKKR